MHLRNCAESSLGGEIRSNPIIIYQINATTINCQSKLNAIQMKMGRVVSFARAVFFRVFRTKGHFGCVYSTNEKENEEKTGFLVVVFCFFGFDSGQKGRGHNIKERVTYQAPYNWLF